MNAVIYARYSSEKQNERSIEDQIKACQKFAKENDFNIVNIYSDKAMSGKTDKRPSFQRMIKDSEKKKFKYILCWKFDRISRSTRDYYYYEKILFDNGVNIVSINEPLTDPQAAPILKAINIGMAESYNVTLAININRGLKANARKCKANGPQPFGYIKGENNSIVPDPKTAPFVKEAFEAFLEGNGYMDIATYFNACGLTTRFGNNWNGEAIKRLLKNDKYCGIYRYSDIEIDGGVEPIIDKVTFERVQEKMKSHSRGKNKMLNQENYILNGKLFCGICNEPMRITAGTSKTGKIYRYYRCHNHSIRKDEIEPLVIQLTKQNILTDETIEKIADYAINLQNELMKNSKEASLKEELKDLNKKIDNIVNVIMDGMNSPALQDKLEMLEEKKKQVLIQIEIEKAYNNNLSRDAIVWYLKELQQSEDPDIENEIIDKLVMRIYLDEEKIWIQYKYAEENKNTQTLSLKELECSNNHHLVDYRSVRLNFYQHSIILIYLHSLNLI